MTGQTTQFSTLPTERAMPTNRVMLFVRCLLALSLASTVHSETQHSLTDEEHSRALSIEKAEYSKRLSIPGGVPGLSESPRDTKEETYVVSVAPIGSPSTTARIREALRSDSIPTRRALVTRYEYATGSTIRTWIDLGSDRVLMTRRDINYPTPLAPEELEEAVSLMPSRDDETDAVVNDDDNGPQYSHLVPVSADKTEPRYGHRLVWLWIDSPERSTKYLIDLTMKEVVKSR